MDEWEIINAPPAEEFQSFQQEEGRAEEQVATQPPSDQQQEQPGVHSGLHLGGGGEGPFVPPPLPLSPWKLCAPLGISTLQN